MIANKNIEIKYTKWFDDVQHKTQTDIIPEYIKYCISDRPWRLTWNMSPFTVAGSSPKASNIIKRNQSLMLFKKK